MPNKHICTDKSQTMPESQSCFKLMTAFILLLGLYSLMPSCHKAHANPVSTDTTTTTRPDTPSTSTPALTTDTLIGDGVDLQPSYYNGGNVTFGYPLMQQYPNIKSVRIEIEPSVPIALAASWIQQAHSNGYKVIATYHKYTVLGTDDTTQLDTAAMWWRTNYSTLSASGSITVNLMNEWGSHNQTPATYATAYNQAIAIVRQVYSGPIIIDCAGYGQETSVAADAVRGIGGIRLNDSNIILSAHIYPNGYNQANNHTLQQSDLDSMAASGRPCIVGEFGNSPSGNADWSGLASYGKSLHWAILGWAWNGDGGTMNMVTPAWDTTANASTYSPSAYFTVIYSLL